MSKKVILLLIVTSVLLAETKILNSKVNKEKVLQVSKDEKVESFSGKLFFDNNDKLVGRLIEYNSKSVVWKHPQALSNLSFRNDNIKEIFFSDYKSKFLINRKTEVRLVNGDTIFGDLIEFNDLELIIDTTYAGRLTINRVAIHALRPASQLDYNLYNGPKNLDKWVHKSSGDTKWTAHDGSLILIQDENTREIGISREFNFIEKFEINFDYKWNGSANLTVHVFAKDVKDYNNGSYRFSFNHSNVTLNKRSSNRGNYNRLGYQSNIQALKGKSAKMSIKIDREKSEFYLFMNDILIKKFDDKFGAKILGNSLAFASNRSCEIANLSLNRWDGAVSSELNLQNKNFDKDKIVFSNNDSVSGIFKGINKGIIEFESSFGKLPNLTLDRVSLIIFANQQTKKQKYKENDVQLFFNDRKLTFQLDKIKDGIIYGKSVSLGEVAFGLKGFKKISFKPSN